MPAATARPAGVQPPKALDPRPKWTDDRDECHFCGKKYGKSSVGSGSFGGPTTPVNVQYCPNCSGPRPPSEEEAVGQGGLFK